MLDLYFKLVTWLKREEGQDLVEYALLLALIAIICAGAILLAGRQVSTIWSQIVSSLSI